MNRMSLLGVVSACAVSFSIASGPVNAAFVLTIDDVSNGIGTDVTVTDDDLNGIISYSSTTLGAFTFVSIAGVSKSATTSPQLLDLNSLEVSGGAGDLIISLTDTDYSGSPAALTGLFGGTTIGSVNFNFLYDENNAQFAGTSFFDPPVTTTSSFSGEGTGIPATPSASYSLTIIAEVIHSGSGVTSFDAEIRAVPVPAAVWLFGSGLLGLAGIARRKKAA